MPRQKISRSELEQRLAGQTDPVSQLPRGFPTMHSKVPPTPSRFAAAALQRAIDEGATDDSADAGESKVREEIRERFRRSTTRR